MSHTGTNLDVKPKNENQAGTYMVEVYAQDQAMGLTLFGEF
jgi:hypothetical protein